MSKAEFAKRARSASRRERDWTKGVGLRRRFATRASESVWRKDASCPERDGAIPSIFNTRQAGRGDFTRCRKIRCGRGDAGDGGRRRSSGRRVEKMGFRVRSSATGLSCPSPGFRPPRESNVARPTGATIGRRAPKARAEPVAPGGRTGSIPSNGTLTAHGGHGIDTAGAPRENTLLLGR